MINRLPQEKSAAAAKDWRTENHGSITVEAAIVLPGLLAFVMLMVSLIQLASAELALQAAVTETGKSVAVYWPPVRRVYSEAKARAAQTAAGTWTSEALGRLESARNQWTSGEEWMLQYEGLLPDAAVKLIQWEIDNRRQLEQQAQNTTEDAVGKIIDPILCRAFQPIIMHYANSKLLRSDRLTVESVRLPSLEAGGNPWVEINASYQLKLPVPFWNKTVVLQKSSIERAWVGEE